MKWSAPSEGILKINMDGSSKENPSLVGIGGVHRDRKEDIQFMFSICKGLHTNNLMEAIAIFYALKNACDLGWRRLTYESNSQVVIHCEKLAFIADQIKNLSTSLVCYFQSYSQGMEYYC